MPPLDVPELVPTLEPAAYDAWKTGIALRETLAGRKQLAKTASIEQTAKVDQLHQSVLFALDSLPFCEDDEDYTGVLGFAEANGLVFDGANVLAADPKKVVQDNPSHPLNKLRTDNKSARARAMLLFGCFTKGNGFTYSQEEEIIAHAGGENRVEVTISNMRITLFATRSLLAVLSVKEWATNKRKMKVSDFFVPEKNDVDSARTSLRSLSANHLGYYAMRAKRKAGATR